MRKLKNCPFCGKKPKIVPTDWPHENWGFAHYCCFMINRCKIYDTEAKAIKAWNKRAK